MRSTLLALLLLVSGSLLAAARTAASQPGAAAPAPPSAAPPGSAAPGDATAPTAEPGTAAAPPAAPSAYQQHMDNGVKLYREQNYAAAIAEFEAAYRAEPKASPLINLALSYKKQFQYAKAIEVLRRALYQHAGTMKPEHHQAAAREVRELEALLAWVWVKVDPPSAQLFVDDQPVDPAKRGGELALSPGMHRLRAQADGYRTGQQRVQLVSGHGNPPVSLKLAPTTGEVVVAARDPRAWIEVDAKKVGRGHWRGKLPPGVHAVRVLQDEQAHAIEIVVLEGGHAKVQQQEDGELESEAEAPGEGDRRGFGPKVPELLRGLYALGGGSLLVPLVEVPGFKPTGQYQGGGAGSIYLGYRVANWAGFELFVQGGDVRLDLEPDQAATNLDIPIPTSATKLKLRSVRIAPLLRIFAPTRTPVRFVGLVGGGLAIDWLSWMNKDAIEPALQPDRYADVNAAINGMVEIDLGAELELNRVLLALMVQNTFQSTKGFDQRSGVNSLDVHPMLLVGPSVRIGYALW